MLNRVTAPSCYTEIRKGEELLQFDDVLLEASLEHLPEDKLDLDGPKVMIFCVEVRFNRLNQIQKPANWCLWKHYALAGSDDLSPLMVEKLIPSGSELR
jgi:hypothetical protein